MLFPLLIIGVILLTAGAKWFAGAATVGLILTIFGGVSIVIPLVIFILGAVGVAFAARK